MIYFTSDTHFGHGLFFRDDYRSGLAGYPGRPFQDVHAMDSTLITNWCDTVASGDTIVHLGDFALSHRDRIVDLLQRLPGLKVLVRGNHDRSANAMQECGFNLVVEKMVLKVPAIGSVILTHKPLAVPDIKLEAAVCNLHGHRHELPDRDDWHLNLSVEQTDYRPIALEVVAAKIKALVSQRARLAAG